MAKTEEKFKAKKELKETAEIARVEMAKKEETERIQK